MKLSSFWFPSLASFCPIEVPCLLESPWCALKLANQPFEATDFAVSSMHRATRCAFPADGVPLSSGFFQPCYHPPVELFAGDRVICTSSHCAVFVMVRSLLLDVCHLQTCFSFTPKRSAAVLLLPNSFAFATSFNLKAAS